MDQIFPLLLTLLLQNSIKWTLLHKFKAFSRSTIYLKICQQCQILINWEHIPRVTCTLMVNNSSNIFCYFKLLTSNTQDNKSYSQTMSWGKNWTALFSWISRRLLSTSLRIKITSIDLVTSYAVLIISPSNNTRVLSKNCILWDEGQKSGCVT